MSTRRTPQYMVRSRYVPVGVSVLLVGALLGGCTTQPALPPAEPELLRCVELFEETDRNVARLGLRDEGEARVQGFPYLRANRLLASFAGEVADGAPFDAWLLGLAALDAQARDAELWNVSGSAARPLALELDRCRERLVQHDAVTPERRASLRAAVRVPDDYMTAWRVLGLYPITAHFANPGIERWHRELHASFATPMEVLPVRGSLQRWTAHDGAAFDADTVRTVVDAARDPLGVPRPTTAELARLFAAFAPIWEIDVVDDNDRIGVPRRRRVPDVDTAHAVEYRVLSHTRWHGQVLLQLGYAVWFAARPGNDIYGGALDAVIWRVTLGPDGRVLAYDSAHGCGCYHQFFPRESLQLRTDLPRHGLELPPVPQVAPTSSPVVVRLATGTHYIERVYASTVAPRGATPLAVADYSQLRRAPTASGGHGLFGRHGLVPGSERDERFLFWPLGVRSAGAMRQWGRHATAFIGRRHFDDPWLLEQLFEDLAR